MGTLTPESGQPEPIAQPAKPGGPEPTSQKGFRLYGSLSRDQFIKLALVRHFSRGNFYFLAATCSLFTAYAIYQDAWLLLVAVWPPFVLYIGYGIASVLRASRDPASPLFLPTHYEITDAGITVETEQGRSEIAWNEVTMFRVMVGCYVLYLESGLVLAIPQKAVPKEQVEPFEKFVSERLIEARRRWGTREV